MEAPKQLKDLDPLVVSMSVEVPNQMKVPNLMKAPKPKASKSRS